MAMEIEIEKKVMAKVLEKKSGIYL